MPLFECSEEEISFLKRRRTLVTTKISRVLLQLKPLAILEKIDTGVELIEHPTVLPPLPPIVGRV